MLAMCTHAREGGTGRRGDLKTAIRRERLRWVRRRLAEGWYDRDDLLDIVLERILLDIMPA
mgnify:CR=1 FL=1